ncbi:MAG TPA: nucleotide sugar dehydrogenase, partial [Fimbriiglobus sp.]
KLPALRHHPELSGRASQPLTREFLAGLDCVIVATDHSAFDWPKVVEQTSLIIDTRNATKGVTTHRDRIVRA